MNCWLISFSTHFVFFLIYLGYKHSFLLNSFLGVAVLMQILSSLFLSLNIDSPVSSLLTCFFFHTALPRSCFSVYCLRISSFFCFLAVDIGPLYSEKILFFSLCTIWNFVEAFSTFRSWKVQSVSITREMVHILFTVITFFVVFSLTFSSSVLQFSIPALYLTNNTTRMFVALIVFNFDDFSYLTLV